MWAGIAAAARGAASGKGRLTDISHAVETAVRKGGRYGIVDGYGGHGIGTEMHQDPHVLNHGRPGKGPRLVPGMALAIEPMITMGSPRTVELADGWTVVTRDGSMAAHVEHTMALLRRRRVGADRAGRRPGPPRRPGDRPAARRSGLAGPPERRRPTAGRSAARHAGSGPTVAWSGGRTARRGMLAGMDGRDGMRAADADRQAVADRLRVALDEGRLDCTSTTSGCSGLRRAHLRRAGRAAGRPAAAPRRPSARCRRRAAPATPARPPGGGRAAGQARAVPG